MEFERALQAADMALGNDGRIALPYWDWSVNPDEGLPKGIREQFSGWPQGFFPDSLKKEPTVSSLRRANDKSIAAQLRSWRVAETAEQTLLATEHWAHASTRYAGQYPLSHYVDPFPFRADFGYSLHFFAFVSSLCSDLLNRRIIQCMSLWVGMVDKWPLWFVDCLCL